MFDVGDKIIVDNHGVCEIKDIVTCNFGLGEMEYFVLSPVFHDVDTVIRLPKSNHAMLKKIPNKRQANNLVNKIIKNSSIWIDSTKERKAAFNEIIHEGDEEKMAALIYSYITKKAELEENGKVISMTDKFIYERASRILYEEIAIALNIKFHEVDKLIEKKRKKK